MICRYGMLRPSIGTMLDADYDPELHPDHEHTIRVWAADYASRPETPARHVHLLDQLAGAAMAGDKIEMARLWAELQIENKPAGCGH